MSSGSRGFRPILGAPKTTQLFEQEQMINKLSKVYFAIQVDISTYRGLSDHN